MAVALGIGVGLPGTVVAVLLAVGLGPTAGVAVDVRGGVGGLFVASADETDRQGAITVRLQEFV